MKMPIAIVRRASHTTMKFGFCSVSFIALVLTLVACGPNEQRDEQVQQSIEQTPPPASVDSEQVASPPDTIDAYPIATNTPIVAEEGYPAPPSPVEKATIAPFVIPSPGENTGVIVGKMVIEGTDGDPYLATLYLGSTIYANNQVESQPLISFSESDSPIGVQDPDSGEFYFDNIPPGEYALIIWTPVFSMVVNDPITEQSILFEVSPGEVADLGVIEIQ